MSFDIRTQNVPARDRRNSRNQHFRYGARAATGVAGNLIERPAAPHDFALRSSRVSQMKTMARP